MIAILVAWNTLYNNFDIINTSFFKTRDKRIDEIQMIVRFKKANNISKYIIKRIKKLTKVLKDNKKRANSYQESFNCQK